MKSNFSKKAVIALLILCVFSLNFLPVYSQSRTLGSANEVKIINSDSTNDSLINKQPLPLIGLVLLAGALHFSATWAALAMQDGAPPKQNISFTERHRDLKVKQRIDLNKLD